MADDALGYKDAIFYELHVKAHGDSNGDGMGDFPGLTDNPAVREEIWKVMDFWLDRGVDGFRVDAVPYLIEREGTSRENLPETHEVLRFLRRRMDERYPGKVLLAEANMWPEDVRAYFGDGTDPDGGAHL